MSRPEAAATLGRFTLPSLAQRFGGGSDPTSASGPTGCSSRANGSVQLTLSTAMTTERLRGLAPYGPIELFAPSSRPPAVLAASIGANPGLLEWILAGEPVAALHALSVEPALTAAAHAMSIAEPDALASIPNAAKLGASGRDALVKLGARTKGTAKQTIEGLLDGDAEEPAASHGKVGLEGVHPRLRVRRASPAAICTQRQSRLRRSIGPWKLEHDSYNSKR